ncbi:MULTISPECIES: aspartyl-phosphate phosphatase Spo0E family protein [Bacillus]|uniref:Uncharacterized protein n=1 Tax=Bacillus pseudomycoides TaxID=64104 RepID=A0A1Y3ME94_9BACI|nr:aspartyl-phosphate phosphatase Spo0E family protein [Bacillus pseudomycoides]OUM45912.1 hypothetical protein BW425_26680 [Bacillus pseudomycoides]PEK71937.1 aspartyl-phosphate phosphatase Spo0E family protein [Bacillus pseudomycoides]PGE83852.1 aspartyl-phosphate phosphatase Spo0E family protein [Bacillus pseudomycoides]
MKNVYEILNAQIEEKRKEMFFLSKLYGLTSQETIQASQQLDQLLNLARLCIQKNSKVNACK